MSVPLVGKTHHVSVAYLAYIGDRTPEPETVLRGSATRATGRATGFCCNRTICCAQNAASAGRFRGGRVCRACSTARRSSRPSAAVARATGPVNSFPCADGRVRRDADSGRGPARRERGQLPKGRWSCDFAATDPWRLARPARPAAQRAAARLDAPRPHCHRPAQVRVPRARPVRASRQRGGCLAPLPWRAPGGRAAQKQGDTACRCALTPRACSPRACSSRTCLPRLLASPARLACSPRLLPGRSRPAKQPAARGRWPPQRRGEKRRVDRVEKARTANGVRAEEAAAGRAAEV